MNRFNNINIIMIVILLLSCAHKSGHKPYAYDTSRSSKNIELTSQDISQERKVKGHTKVRMEKAGGVYLVPIKVNGLDLKFIKIAHKISLVRLPSVVLIDIV